MEWISCAVVYTVLYGLTRSLADCTIANTIIHGHGTRVSFFKSFKNHTRLSRIHSIRPECNSDKATVGSVVCTVYMDGQPYKPCVLCQTGFRHLRRMTVFVRKTKVEIVDRVGFNVEISTSTVGLLLV